MLTISNLTHLERFGIIPLTGEADALSFRILCDLTRRGKRLVMECFGIGDSFPVAWNTGTPSNPHVGSIMLTCNNVRQLAIVALCEDCHTVFSTKHAVFGLTEGETLIPAQYEYDDKTGEVKEIQPYYLEINGAGEPWPACYGQIERTYRVSSNPHVGTRNVHAMSGRVV